MLRRNALCLSLLLSITIPSLMLNWYGAAACSASPQDAEAEPPHESDPAVQVYYLEIVTQDVDATCAALAEIHGVEFSEPEALLGNARTAPMANGELFSVRAPMHEQEEPVVRPYLLVDDIEAAVKKAQEHGVQFAMMPTEIPGRGTFAIYFQGGMQYGLWQK